MFHSSANRLSLNRITVSCSVLGGRRTRWNHRIYVRAMICRSIMRATKPELQSVISGDDLFSLFSDLYVTREDDELLGGAKEKLHMRLSRWQGYWQGEQSCAHVMCRLVWA